MMLLTDYIWLISILSIVSFISSIIIIPLIIIKIPKDYFIISHKEYVEKRVKHPLLRILLHIIKNILGYIFIIFGIVMLFIPGQGVLTTILGVSLADFPYKKQLEYKLISKPRVLRVINKIRIRAAQEELLL